MPPLSSDHPDPKHIIDTIAEAMHAGVLPFDDEFSLVPNIYQVVLHPNVFAELERVFPTIEARSKVRLDRELARLNASSGKGVHHLIMDGLKGLLKKDRPETLPGAPAQDRYKRAGSTWEILFTQAMTSPFDVSEVLVEAVLDTTRNNNLAGSKTVKLIVRGADGNFSEQTPSGDGLSSHPASSPTQRSPAGEQAALATPSALPPGQTLARLSFKDDKGPQTFMMTQPEISVGRGGEGAPVDLQVHTLPDVSRHHLSLRYDPDTNTFLIKDLSTYGTTVDGRTVASSRSAEGDRDYWERIQQETTIGLAGVLFIDFKSMT